MACAPATSPGEYGHGPPHMPGRMQRRFFQAIRVALVAGLLAFAASACQAMQSDVFVVTSGSNRGADASVGPASPLAGAEQPQAGVGASAMADAASGGTAGRSAPVTVEEPPPDPTVHFDWTETPPKRGPCGPSTFRGTFSCEMSSALALLLYTHVDGTMEVTFSGSSEDRTLNVTQGELRARDDTAREFLVGQVAGNLDCTTRVADTKMLPTTTAMLPLDRQLFWFLPLIQPRTMGWMRGNLDPFGQVINGDLELNFEDQTYCVGTFSLTMAP